MQTDIETIQNWCTENSMELCANKCIQNHFSKKHVPATATYTLFGNKLQTVCQVRDLGV